jgi:hypothetical protein
MRVHDSPAVLRKVTVTSIVPAAAEVPSTAATSAVLRHLDGPDAVVVVDVGTVVDGVVVDDGADVEGVVLRAALSCFGLPDEHAASTTPATTTAAARTSERCR